MERTLEAVATFLFKYPPHLFQRGRVALAPVLPETLLLLVTGAAILAVGLLTFRGIRTPTATRDRVILTGLRAAVLALLTGCLLHPVLLLSRAVPQRNVLGVLLDDSRSMRLADLDGKSRLDAVARVFGDSSGTLAAKLGERFILRFFRFAADAGPVSGVAGLHAAGTRTDLAAALDGARQELAGVPLAGLVLVTDGADNTRADLTPSLLALKARKVPVYTIGVGLERFPRDLAIERVVLPPSSLAGAGVLAEVDVRVRGLGGTTALVTAESDGHIVAQHELPLPAGGDMARARLHLPPLAEGAHQMTFTVRPEAGEVVTENNVHHAVLRVRPGPERILYLEGEPRPEFAFMRRAVAGDSALALVGLLRSSEDKFLRLGVSDSLELAGGFPTRREDLFRYRALVLGSIEAAFFTGDQLRMLADFAGQRGGGLIVLGGRASLVEGGFAGTPLAEVLPVSLDGVAPAGAEAAPAVLAVRATAAGRQHPALATAGDNTAASRFDSLPPLTSVNHLGTLKPGATVLLTGRAADGGAEAPVLAVQRYGRGTVALLGVQDSWLWRMNAVLPLEDRTYETFWRQLLRWALDAVPERVEATAVPSRVAPGEALTLRARVADENFVDANDAAVTAWVVTPTGRRIEVPLQWTLREEGVYEGRYVPEESGMYQLETMARRGRDTSRAPVAAFLADNLGADVEEAELRAPLLRRIAGETGGRYYPLAQANGLVEDVSYTESGVVEKESRDLWDMPVVFFLLVMLLGGEWGWRRWRGLA